MNSTYIIDGIRTPIGNLGGILSAIRPDDMAAMVIAELVKRNGQIDTAKIGDVILGCANQAGEDNRNIARMALLLAGLPYTVPGETVNRLCASGMSALINGSRAIAVGDADLMIVGGVESMTRAPFVMSKPSTAFGRDSEMFDSSFGWRFVNRKMEESFGVDSMGNTAENLAELYKISREDQDRFALWSQVKAAIAEQSGRLSEERMAFNIPQRKGEMLIVEKDEFIKPTTTLEALGKLRPAFRKDGTVTAGNSSGLNDGASVVLLASEKAIKEQNLKPKARVLSSAVIGVEPRIMGIGPVEASKLALTKAGLSLDQIDVIEINEAFAAQYLSCEKELGLDRNKVNVNGGAIALGHPLGASGARILLTLMLELRRRRKKYGVASACIGGGQGIAMIIEAL